VSAAARCRPAGRDGVDAAVRHLRHRLGVECGVRPAPGRRGPGGDCTATLARLDAGGPVVGRCRGRPVGSWNGSPRRSTVLARARSGHSRLRGGVAVAGACRCGFSHRTATPDPGRHINPGRWTRIAADLLESVRIRPAVLLWVSRPAPRTAVERPKGLSTSCRHRPSAAVAPEPDGPPPTRAGRVGTGERRIRPVGRLAHRVRVRWVELSDGRHPAPDSAGRAGPGINIQGGDGVSI